MQRGLWIGTGLPFARAFGDAVDCIVLGRRSNSIVFLHGLRHLDTKPGNQVRIFTVSVFDTSPTLIARNVQGRCVNICVAERSTFVSFDPSDFTD